MWKLTASKSNHKHRHSSRCGWEMYSLSAAEVARGQAIERTDLTNSIPAL
jgi:hypothetical protein